MYASIEPPQGYHNVKMLLFRPFLSYNMQNPLSTNDALATASENCISSAQRTIEAIYDMYKVHAYFRTWFAQPRGIEFTRRN